MGCDMVCNQNPLSSSHACCQRYQMGTIQRSYYACRMNVIPKIKSNNTTTTNHKYIVVILIAFLLFSSNPAVLSAIAFHFSSQLKLSRTSSSHNTARRNLGKVNCCNFLLAPSNQRRIQNLRFDFGLRRSRPTRVTIDSSSRSGTGESSQFRNEMSSNLHNSTVSDGGGVSTLELSFSHVHLYVDYVDDMESYKRLEDCLNQYANQMKTSTAKEHFYNDEPNYLSTCRILWNQIISRSNISTSNVDESYDNNDDENFPFWNRDIVRQLISGLGFRITAARMDDTTTTTRTVLVTSSDAKGGGVQFVITSLPSSNIHLQQQQYQPHQENEDSFHHFDQSQLHRFYNHYHNRQGIAVLAFEITAGSIHDIFHKYRQYHPNLLIEDVIEYSTAKLLEVYAYYAEDNIEPERGTILRFLQKQPSSVGESFLLPGLTYVPATFDSTCLPAYCDHWVSNVFSRTTFLQVLQDSLGFTTKVNFNAGVVAAGEAQIESTVSGNSLPLTTGEAPVTSIHMDDEDSAKSIAIVEAQKKALTDQRQVYLPINNALSSVGHVHWFLQEIGQGVQHIASRVEDLATFISRANHYRKVTGEGLTFLNIPRSYYGVLTTANLQRLLGSNYWQDQQNQQPLDPYRHESTSTTTSAVLSLTCASEIMSILEKYKFIGPDGSLYLNVKEDSIEVALNDSLLQCDKDRSCGLIDEYANHRKYIVQTILRSRYINLYMLLFDRLDQALYLQIVKNKILVDIQGDDLLFQIFTCNILQRKSGEEAPFLEFIQRRCGSGVATAGCGGFGIRNFLTLFLSIELSKAMKDAQAAKRRGDVQQQTYYDRMTSLFTEQLNESNPILTEIADCMTGEGRAKEMITLLSTTIPHDDDNDKSTITMWQERLNSYEASKRVWNSKLMECSQKYKTLMKQLREENEKVDT